MVRVAIVGAGVGGGALAKFLARYRRDQEAAERFEISLFDRRPAPDGPDGGALTLQGEGLDVMTDLGLSNTLTAISACETSGESGPQVLMLRDALLRLLLENVDGQVSFNFNKEITQIREMQRGVELDHRPLLVCADGRWLKNNDPAITTQTFDLVVGADGNAPASCVVRNIVGCDAAQARPLNLLILQALVPSQSVAKGVVPKEAYIRQGVHGIVAKIATSSASGLTTPSAPARFQPWEVCTITKVRRDPMNTFPTPSEWEEEMKQTASQCTDTELQQEALAIIGKAAKSDLGGRLHAWVPFRKDALDHWWSPGGRLVALGDAAHLMPPTKGWGANCALGDAKKLSEVLLLMLESGLLTSNEPADWQGLGKQFETERRIAVAPRVSASLAEARRIAGRV
eukprot:TRINITY_DN77320_c0_g1_i1.p1 TRINITY_DN77320_c0_g1~~TRINITY_DN77320_c0_g1_i1.p1  ORF type:complete len:400 (-),score=77.17 TRINITY_DN77320_c0_g1_i1:23-1222(-)